MKQLMGLILICWILYISSNSAYERPLVIVVPSYNNAQWYEKNLASIFAQKYTHYRIIYIDDCSHDNTYNFVAQYIHAHGQQQRVTLIKNNTRLGALANHYKAAHQCDDYEIIIQLDGDDWFAHDNVLARINQEYADPNIWMTYGQHEVYPSGKIGQCKEIPRGVITRHAYREYEWVTSALRTFYAGLFKKIKLQDLIEHGRFFQSASDLACMFPMLEMGHERVKYIDEILYIYNCATTLNDYKKNLPLQRHCEYVIRGRKKYRPLPHWSDMMGSDGADSKPIDNDMGSAISHATSNDITHPVAILIFSKSGPAQLDEFLKNLQKKIIYSGPIVVMYQPIHEAEAQEYELVIQTYNNQLCEQCSVFPKNLFSPMDMRSCVKDTLCVKDSSCLEHSCCLEHIFFSIRVLGINATIDFKATLQQLLSHIPQRYIMLVNDTDNIPERTKKIDLSICAQALNMTHAHGFFLLLDTQKKETIFLCRQLRLPRFITFDYEPFTELPVCAWQFKDGEYEWATAHCLTAAIYLKTMFMQSVIDMRFDSADELMHAWQLYPVDSCAMGLCFFKKLCDEFKAQ